MLRLYQRLAKYLNPFRGILMLLACLVAASFTLILFSGDPLYSERWLLPLLVIFIFLLCLLLMLFLFSTAENLPSGRIKRLFYRFWQWLLAIVLTALLLFWFFLFLRSLSAIIRQFW